MEVANSADNYPTVLKNPRQPTELAASNRLSLIGLRSTSRLIIPDSPEDSSSYPQRLCNTVVELRLTQNSSIKPVVFVHFEILEKKLFFRRFSSIKK